MLAELGMIYIPPRLSSDNRIAVLESGSIPTYHAEQGKHIGENGDRQERTGRSSGFAQAARRRLSGKAQQA